MTKSEADRDYFHPGIASRDWWRQALGDTGAGRMARAKLRKCDTAAEALLVPQTHDLFRRLCTEIQTHLEKEVAEGMVSYLRNQPDVLALLAITLANVRRDTTASAPHRMKDKLSPFRFQRLMRIEEPRELVRPMRRAIAQIDHSCNVMKLSNDLYRWGIPEVGEAIRNRWAFAYYDSESAAPNPSQENHS